MQSKISEIKSKLRKRFLLSQTSKFTLKKAVSEPNSVEITHTNRNKNGNVKLLMLTVGNEMLRH